MIYSYFKDSLLAADKRNAKSERGTTFQQNSKVYEIGTFSVENGI